VIGILLCLAIEGGVWLVLHHFWKFAVAFTVADGLGQPRVCDVNNCGLLWLQQRDLLLPDQSLRPCSHGRQVSGMQ
jgi:hypothetical protein